ncbi:hypothetical protein CQW23_08418 [Capsicum baccatum]|uniref:KIB1-4 beta-propeller domain-containing protein n=1 Tax=Capsicum baccatum TaxID=33114 RepID=A0A2G2X8X6_CAPBA|nr:hypothetical protein CQW23_08418 [Capsicum baccatum]
MLAEEEDNEGNSSRRFFSVYDGTILKKRIPKTSRKRCMGLLITVGEDDGEISLLHPFSDFCQLVLLIHLITFSLSLRGACVSSVSRVIWEGIHQNLFADLVYFNGEIYTVNYSGEVLVCDVADFVGPEPTKVSRYGVQLRPIQDDCDSLPLTVIPAERELLGEDPTYGTTYFRVFQVDLETGKVTETEELGDMAFFLGANASLSVQPSQYPGIKPNRIYFTDDFLDSYTAYEEGGGLDMGVHNVADGSIQQPHYDGVSLSWFCPPIWIGFLEFGATSMRNWST